MRILTRRQNQALERVKVAGRKGISAKQLAVEMRIAPQGATSILNALTYYEVVRRTLGRGRGWTYFYREQVGGLKYKGSGNIAEEQKKMAASSVDLEGLLIAFASKKWQPRLVNTYNSFPRMIVRLYNLAKEGLYGSTVSKEDLQGPREELIRLQQSALGIYRAISAVLDQPELWDPKTFAQFLTEVTPIEELESIALQAREKN